MKKLVVLGVVLLTTLGMVTVVQAATSKCTSFSCVNKQINKLTDQNKTLKTQIKQMQAQIDQLVLGQDPKLYDCLREIPVSQYNDYLADDGVTSITGLDLDTSGSPDYWTIVDTCYSDPVFPHAPLRLPGHRL